MKPKQTKPITKCIRCGNCCMKGGPALHDDDIKHIDGGAIPLTSLYTIRKGELANDNINGGLVCMPSEIVKIKSMPDAQTCIYFNEAEKSCEIYDTRPIECRAMECWDTTKIENIYAKDRLTRNDILRNVSWLRELVETHECQCSLDKIQVLVNARESGDHSAASKLSEAINYDSQLRNLAVEKGRLPVEILDFLFGRPLFLIIRKQFGVKIDHKNSG